MLPIMAEIFNSYKSAVDLTPLVSLCEKEGKRVIYQKGDYLLHQGDVEQHISLVKSDYCRYVSLKSNGDEAVVGFSMVGEFVADFNNGVCHLPSMVSLIASSHVEVLQVPIESAMSTLLESDPLFLYKASDALFRVCYARLVDIYTLTPAERYEKFVNSYPDITSQIMLKELASFLQISPQHLLRIKKNVKN